MIPLLKVPHSWWYSREYPDPLNSKLITDEASGILLTPVSQLLELLHKLVMFSHDLGIYEIKRFLLIKVFEDILAHNLIKNWLRSAKNLLEEKVPPVCANGKWWATTNTRSDPLEGGLEVTECCFGGSGQAFWCFIELQFQSGNT